MLRAHDQTAGIQTLGRGFTLKLHWYPVNMRDPICIRAGSARNYWPEAGWMILAHWLASGPDLFGQNLVQSARIKSDPGWFCTILSRTNVEEQPEPSLKVGNWQRTGCILPETRPGRWFPAAHQLASRWDEFSQTALARPSRSDPGRFCTV